jgi:hypothetical protein
MNPLLPPAPFDDARAACFAERRKHPRLEGPELACAARTPRHDPRPASHARTLRGLMALMLRVPGRSLAGRGSRLIAARSARLPRIAERLERILAELDALEAWREASDVSAAIEHIRTGTD